MKKNNLIAIGALLAGVAFVSCSKDGYQEVSRTLTGHTLTIITDETDETVTVSPGYYTFSLKMTDSSNTGTVTSPELIANNTSLGFTTDSLSYASTGYDVYFKNVVATAGNTTMQISNSEIMALYLYGEMNNKYGYYYDTTNIGDYTYQINSMSPWITVAKYNIGSTYKVNTFPVTTFFKGNTRTTYPANPQGFSTDDITYRFTLKKDKDSNVYTADMILYNARFAAEMPFPLVAVLVKDLDVDFTPNGVKITGTDIIPQWYTDGEFQDLERYIFKSVNFTTTNEYYTQCSLTYHVGEDYDGYFSGAYLDTYYMK